MTGRGGKGVITIKTTGKTGLVVGAFQVTDDTQVILITTHAGKIIRLKASDISVYGRGTQGLRLIDLEPEEKDLPRILDKIENGLTEDLEEQGAAAPALYRGGVAVAGRFDPREGRAAAAAGTPRRGRGGDVRDHRR